MKPPFLGYALQNTNFINEVVANSTGVSYPAINPGSLVCLRVAYPRAKEEQRKIAAFLDGKTAQIDALIAKKRELIEKLKEKRLAVITQAVTKGLDPKAPMRDSGIPWLGKVPAHWDVKRLKFVGESIIGLTYDPVEIVNENDGTLVLRASNIQNGRLVDEDNVYVTTEIPDALRLREGDILICTRNGSRHLIGKNGRVTAPFVGKTFGAFTTVFRSASSHFAYYVFNSSLFDYQQGSFMTSTINQLTINTLSSMVIPIPSLLEQAKIAEHLDAQAAKLEVLIGCCSDAIARLTEYRSTLITAATTGQIDLRGWQPEKAAA